MRADRFDTLQLVKILRELRYRLDRAEQTVLVLKETLHFFMKAR